MAIQIRGNQIKSNTIGVTKLDLSTGTFDYSGAVLRSATPSGDSDVTNKSYVDGLVASGVYWKTSVKCATTVAITLASELENGDTIDGVTLVTGDRVLVKNQAGDQAPFNGIYIVKASGAPDRASDMASSTQFSGSAMFCEQGSVNGDQGFTCTNNGSVNVGTTDITFTQFTGTGGIDAGLALEKVNNTLNVRVDDASIEIQSDALQIKDLGIASGKLAGNITNGKLQNSTISGVALGGTLAVLEKASNGGVAFSNYNGSTGVNNLKLDLNDLASAVVNVANDSIAIYDADAGVTSKEAISDLMLAVAGGGINSVAGVLSVNIDGSSLEDNAGQIRVKALGITDGMLAGSISDAKMASDYVQTSEVDDASIEFTSGTLNVKASGISNTMLAGGIADSKLASDYVQTSEVDDASIEFTGGTLNVKASGVQNAMLAGAITNDKLQTITAGNKVSGSAIQLASGSGLADSTGLKIDAGGVTDAMLAGSISDSKLASNYVQTSEVDNSSIEFTGGTLNVKANGVSNTMLAGGITTSKLALRTEISTLTPDGNTSAFDLDDALSANTELVLCFRNGLCITQVASNPSDEDSFTIAPTGGTGGVALITFGANISATDSVKVFYVK